MFKLSQCVNKTSRDQGGACANDKRKLCNRIPSDITIGRNYAAWGYLPFVSNVNKRTLAGRFK